jgi:hypothetical protein
VIAALLLLGTAVWPQEGYSFKVEKYGTENLTLSLMSESEVEQSFVKNIYTNPLYYLFFLPGPILSVLLFAGPGKSQPMAGKIRRRSAGGALQGGGIIWAVIFSAFFFYRLIESITIGIHPEGAKCI